jgi:hypothetical protein
LRLNAGQNMSHHKFKRLTCEAAYSKSVGRGVRARSQACPPRATSGPPSHAQPREAAAYSPASYRALRRVPAGPHPVVKRTCERTLGMLMPARVPPPHRTTGPPSRTTPALAHRSLVKGSPSRTHTGTPAPSRFGAPQLRRGSCGALGRRCSRVKEESQGRVPPAPACARWYQKGCTLPVCAPARARTCARSRSRARVRVHAPGRALARVRVCVREGETFAALADRATPARATLAALPGRRPQRAHAHQSRCQPKLTRSHRRRVWCAASRSPC